MRAAAVRPHAIALAALLIALQAQAADRSLEYAVKATFLSKFASFVDWPPGSLGPDGAPFHLCIVGDYPYGGRIEAAVAGQNVDRHPIVLRRLARVRGDSQCHAVFVAGSNIDAVEYLERDTNVALIQFSIEVRDRTHLADVIRKVRRLGVVHGVQRQ